MSVMPENEPPHYDTDAVTGNEIYPERDGDHFYIATTDETRIFAKKKDGTPYYARKSTGEEFYPHINGLPVYVYDPDQSVRYALDALGKPVYPKDAQGDEIYVRRKDGRMSIGKNKDDNHVYARKNGLLRSESYYPEDGEIGYRKDGTPVYCTRPEQPFVLYPTDAQGNEFYLRGKNSPSDFIHYADDDDPKAILWPVGSYARDRLGNDIYPVRVLDGGLSMDVIPVNLNYTRNRNEEYIYPLDEYGNEYTWVDWTVEEHAFPVGYPVTHDGFVIVPNVQNRPFFLPVDVSKEPEVTLSRIVHLLPRQPSTDFLTNVPAVRLSRNVNRGVDYAREPVRDLTLYVNDAGDTSYTVDPRGDQVYRDTLDVTQLFATRDGKPYYARRADGSEYYPTVGGGHVLLSDAGGKQRYARRRQKEIYPRGRDGRDYVILVQGRPVYATDEEGRAYYPQGGDGKEYLVSMEWIHHNGTVIYPVQNLPPDPSNPAHTNTLISSSHPLKALRIPYYPWDGMTEQYGRNSDGSYQFLQVPGEHHPRYARKLDPSTNQKVEFYPPDHGCIYMGDEPLYALDAQNHPIFPVNGDRDEYYLPHKSLDMDPIHYYVAGNWFPLPRFLYRGGGRAIFGVPLTVQGVPYRNHVMNALNGFVAPRKRTPCQVCIDVMDWSRPYRFDMIRDHVVRLRFMMPDDGLEGDDHWKRLIQLDKDTFKYLVARIMAEKDWSRCRKN
ncbi:hypothetical protein JTE90_020629 [Oedothorax gibbosus]|uniref:Uncharacterized protein n=1 Tax=Oedothorax gibbosus TaxID=931172 RepID=A0AAV6TTB3_9ARAC|nr:hypothetical protein JTE90_020629 [Oedothorax gibbosus]